MREKLLGCFGLSQQKNGDLICTLFALLIGVGITSALNGSSLFSLAFALAIISIFEINKFLDAGGKKDNILIGKVVGVWIAFTAIIFGAIKIQIPSPFVVSAILAFGGFLLFSRWRPSSISWLDRNLKGGLGVILAEVVAGFAGGVLGLVILSLSPAH